MKCTICHVGNVRPGATTLTLEHEGATVVFRGVPARICQNCGEEYIDEEIAQRLFGAVEEAARAGVQLELRQYTAA